MYKIPTGLEPTYLLWNKMLIGRFRRDLEIWKTRVRRPQRSQLMKKLILLLDSRRKSSLLPAYCDPPNPCPRGYTQQVSPPPQKNCFTTCRGYFSR